MRRLDRAPCVRQRREVATSAKSFKLPAFRSPKYSTPLLKPFQTNLPPVLPPRRPQVISANGTIVVCGQLEHSDPRCHLKTTITRIGFCMGQRAWRQLGLKGLSHSPLTPTRLVSGATRLASGADTLASRARGRGTRASTVRLSVAVPFFNRHMRRLSPGFIPSNDCVSN